MNGNKRPIRIVVTDLDGTLLRNDKSISPRTRRAIALLRKKGALFVAATARPIRGVRGFLPALSCDGALYHNGAVVMWEGRRLEGFGIEHPLEVLRAVRAEDPARWVALEADDVLYSNFDPEEIWPGVESVRTEDFHEVESLTADKIIVEARTVAEAEALQARLPESLYAQLSENRIAMIMNRRATKLNGVRLLAARLGISLDGIAAFGDDYNDIEMLRECGVGVAVENALEEVKAAADEICPANEEDGFAQWVEGMLGEPGT